jgi:hypothetical protein
VPEKIDQAVSYVFEEEETELTMKVPAYEGRIEAKTGGRSKGIILEMQLSSGGTNSSGE